MTGFLDAMAARAQGVPVAGTTPLHLRRPARFEPQPDGTPLLPGMRAAASGGESREPRRRAAPRSAPGAAPADAHEKLSHIHPKTWPNVANGRMAAQGPPLQAAIAPAGPSDENEMPADPAPRRPTASSASQPPPPPVTAPDPVAVVRDRVVPVLVEAGVLGADEEVEVVDAAAPKPASEVTTAASRPGVQLRVDTANRAGPDRRDHTNPEPWKAPGSVPDVHVHIGRIEVIRAPAPPPPSPALPARVRRTTPAVDHADYLARRRELR